MFLYQTMILLRKPTIFYLFDFIIIAFVNMKKSFEHKAAVVSLETRKSNKEVQKKYQNSFVKWQIHICVQQSTTSVSNILVTG